MPDKSRNNAELIFVHHTPCLNGEKIVEELSTHAQDFLVHLRARNLSPSTVSGYRVDLEHFEGFLKKVRPSTLADERVTTVSESELVSFVAQKKEAYSAATVYRQTGTVRSFYRWLFKVGRIERNPTLHLKCVRVPARITVPTHAIDDFVSKEEPLAPSRRRDHLTAKLICETGMRISEVLTLNRGDVKDQVVLLRPSGKKSREIPVSKELADALRRYITDTGEPTDTPETPLFLNKNRGRITSRSVRRHLSRNSINPRTLRIRFVQIQRERGVDDRVIAERLGLDSHFSIGYIPSAPPRKKRAIAATNAPKNGKLKATRKTSSPSKT